MLVQEKDDLFQNGNGSMENFDSKPMPSPIPTEVDKSMDEEAVQGEPLLDPVEQLFISDPKF